MGKGGKGRRNMGKRKQRSRVFGASISRRKAVSLFPAALSVLVFGVDTAECTSHARAGLLHDDLDAITNAKEIVCWGDSITKGDGASEAHIIKNGVEVFDASYMSYPDVLQRLTNITTLNLGVPGATSEEIAIMQGGIPFLGRFKDPGLIDLDVLRKGRCHPGDVLLLEIGSNGGWGNDYNVLIWQYRAMIDYAHCDQFIIIGDTDDPGESIADLEQQPFDADDEDAGERETAWEVALREEFGERFINMRQFLVKDGLSEAGLEATEEDLELAAQGIISPQLRADWTHLNSYGYYAKAVAIYHKGIDLGFWDSEE